MNIEYQYEPSGKCPVQSQGKVNGFPFYFRSRGERQQLHIATMADVRITDVNINMIDEMFKTIARKAVD